MPIYTFLHTSVRIKVLKTSVIPLMLLSLADLGIGARPTAMNPQVLSLAHPEELEETVSADPGILSGVEGNPSMKPSSCLTVGRLVNSLLYSAWHHRLQQNNGRLRDCFPKSKHWKHEPGLPRRHSVNSENSPDIPQADPIFGHRLYVSQIKFQMKFNLRSAN